MYINKKKKYSHKHKYFIIKHFKKLPTCSDEKKTNNVWYCCTHYTYKLTPYCYVNNINSEQGKTSCKAQKSKENFWEKSIMEVQQRAEERRARLFLFHIQMKLIRHNDPYPKSSYLRMHLRKFLIILEKSCLKKLLIIFFFFFFCLCFLPTGKRPWTKPTTNMKNVWISYNTHCQE